MALIDFHTHKNYDDKTVFVKAHCLDEQVSEKVKFFTIGVHPWSVTKIDLYSALENIENKCKDPRCIAIGEIGLDKLKPDFELQMTILHEQLILAQRLDKPVVLHVIKAYNNILQLRKTFSKTPWAIHGFNQNLLIANQLVSKGIYLSFGYLLLDERSKAARTFPNIDKSKIFLETDDKALHIAQLYSYSKRFFPNIEAIITDNFKQFTGNVVR